MFEDRLAKAEAEIGLQKQRPGDRLGIRGANLGLIPEAGLGLQAEAG